MRAKEITNGEIRELGVGSLPTRPTAPAAFGGRGYTATELKAAFDKLPCLIIERLNALLEDIGDVGDEALSAAIPTGITEGHTLRDLFDDVASGVLAGYLTVGNASLASRLADIETRLTELEGRLADGEN